MKTNQEEPELVRQAQSGCEKSFLALMKRNEKMLKGYLSRLHLTVQDQQDLLQEIKLAAFQGIKTFKGDSLFMTWLGGVIRNLYRDHTRSQKRREWVQEDIEKIPSPFGPDRLFGAHELLSKVDALMAKEPAKAQEILYLFTVEGLTGREVAKVLGCSHAVVKGNLHTLRLKLRQKCEQV